jgi:hypothetical protein
MMASRPVRLARSQVSRLVQPTGSQRPEPVRATRMPGLTSARAGRALALMAGVLMMESRRHSPLGRRRVRPGLSRAA